MDTIKRAHHIIDLGPGAGVRGGEIVAEGTAAELKAKPEVDHRPLPRRSRWRIRSPHQRAAGRADATGRDLPAPPPHRGRAPMARAQPEERIDLVAIAFRLSVITGVSGSGKSTLAREVLHENCRRWWRAQHAKKHPHSPAANR